jgi:hypothetical protein
MKTYKYAFTTLAVGEPYLTTALNTQRGMASKSSALLGITTDKIPEFSGKTEINHISLDNYHCTNFTNGAFSFHLNLKVLSIKHMLNRDLDYVVYIDGDWELYDGFSEEKMQAMFDYMEKNNLDYLFERPCTIGGSKLNLQECFFPNKIRDYDVMTHTKWDAAHVPNEQFLVFKNNWKLKFFVQRWEMFLWYSIHNNIQNYPDGFEIGVAALESDMHYDYYGYQHYIRQCFQFKTRFGGEPNIRF